MSDLADLAHFWGQDITAGPTGDLGTVVRSDRTSQRLIRRLLTNPGGTDYLWQPDYGAGLPALIGQPLDLGALDALIRGQIALEPSVAQNPAPVINLIPVDGGVSISVAYFDNSGAGGSFVFALTGAAPAR
jgi:hypothetical protein